MSAADDQHIASNYSLTTVAHASVVTTTKYQPHLSNACDDSEKICNCELITCLKFAERRIFTCWLLAYTLLLCGSQYIFPFWAAFELSYNFTSPQNG